MAHVRKSDIVHLGEIIAQLIGERRESTIQILAKIDQSSNKILAAVFTESRRLRKAIGYQLLILKTLEDNVQRLEFAQEGPVSSKIELSVGANIGGTGVKWVSTVDTTRASREVYAEFLEAISAAPGVPQKMKIRLRKKVTDLLNKA